MKKEYNADYFLKFFKKIPYTKWSEGMLKCSNGTCCSLGLLGVRERKSDSKYMLNKKSRTYAKLVQNFDMSACNVGIDDAIEINDTQKCFGDNPKERVIVALENLKQAGF